MGNPSAGPTTIQRVGAEHHTSQGKRVVRGNGRWPRAIIPKAWLGVTFCRVVMGEGTEVVMGELSLRMTLGTRVWDAPVKRGAPILVAALESHPCPRCQVPAFSSSPPASPPPCLLRGRCRRPCPYPLSPPPLPPAPPAGRVLGCIRFRLSTVETSPSRRAFISRFEDLVAVARAFAASAVSWMASSEER